MRIVDEETRRLIHQKRLESLEEDNFSAKNRQEDLAALQEEEFIPDADLPSKRKRKSDEKKLKAKRKMFLGKRKTVEQILYENGYSADSKWPNYLTMMAKPSAYPRRTFCCICGKVNKYT